MKRLPYRWLAAAACALFAAACAQSNGDINRVQPNVMRKADLLDGQWYIRNTVTWTPATTGFTFAGETGVMEKVVWEVTEDSLVGYRAYPYLPGSDQKIEETSKPSGTTTKICVAGKCTGGHPFYGAPIVGYRLQGHFDIQRNYNPATGEEGNVISENGHDRPWNEREYIRVDWSSSFVNQAGSMGWGTFGNPAGPTTEMNSWIQANEPGSDPYDWPSFEYAKDGAGKDSLKYFDFTSRHMATPEQIFIEDYGNIPLCYLSPRYDCTSNEIRVRTSVAKIDSSKVNDYEPLEYGNDLMSKFGYFRTERLTYDRKFGYTEPGRILLANRFNIWKGSYQKDSAGVPDQSKPIPFAERTPKPIVYFVTPADRVGGKATYLQYLESSRELQAGWNHAFRRAVAAAQGKGEDLSSVPQMLHVCENPVPAVDSLTGKANPVDGPCGPPGTAPKFGDLRYSFMYTIVEPVPNGLLGYGPSSPDPETGEIISANANTYTGAVDTYGQYGLDIIDTLSGDKTIDQLISGQDVKDYILSNPAYASAYATQNSSLSSELQGIPRSNEPSRGAFERPTAKMANLLEQLTAQGGLPESKGDRVKAASELLSQNPSLESMILDNPELQQDVLWMLPAQLQKQAEGDPSAVRQAIKKVLLRLPDFVALDKQRIDWASRKNIYLAEFFDRQMLGLAIKESKIREARQVELQAEGKSAYQARVQADQEIRRRLQQSVWRATSEHEIGHTFGLRHNFQGSFDALNYFDTYWDLKKPTLTVEQNGQKVLPRTPDDMKRASDGTQTQLESGMHEYEYSSIMDYGGKMNADWAGIGKYDEAAILFAYSGGTEPGFVEVFETARTDAKNWPGSDGKVMSVVGAGQALPIVNAQRKSPAVPNYTERYHYSTLPLSFGQAADISATIDNGLLRMKARKLAKWSEVKAAHAQVSAKLSTNPNPSAAQLGPVPLEVPYMFCTDDHVGYVLSCNRFDRGPDYYEMNRSWLEDYWNGYFFSHFRRDRYDFSSDRATNNAYGTFDNASLVYKHWVRQFFDQATTANQATPRYPVDPMLQDTWTMATLDGINNLIRVMSVPPAGYYAHITPAGGQYAVACRDCWTVASEGDDFDNLNAAGQKSIRATWQQFYGADKFVVMPRGEARRTYSRYDYKSGFGFFNRMVEVGHYNDQFGAMFASVMPQASFLGVDDVADFRRYNIPYYLVFNQELADTFGAIWANNEADRSPTMYLAKDANGSYTVPKLEFQTKIHGETYVQDFGYPKSAGNFEPAQIPARANPETTWTARIYSIYLGMALFNVNYDLDYAKANQIFRVGAGEAIPQGLLSPGFQLVTVDDFTNGTSYAAIEKVGATKETPAVRMIHIAQQYRADYEAEKTEVNLGYFKDQVRDLDLMRGMYAIYGKAF